jgi:hypothetical protein
VNSKCFLRKSIFLILYFSVHLKGISLEPLNPWIFTRRLFGGLEPNIIMQGSAELSLFSLFENISILFIAIKQTILIRTDKHRDGRKLFRFKPHCLATMGEILLPGDIVIFTFMTIYSRSFHGPTIFFDSMSRFR